MREYFQLPHTQDPCSRQYLEYHSLAEAEVEYMLDYWDRYKKDYIQERYLQYDRRRQYCEAQFREES